MYVSFRSLLAQSFTIPNKMSIIDALTSQQRRRLKRLKRYNVPSVMRVIVALCFAAGLTSSGTCYDFTEFFAGAKAVSKGLKARGYCGVTYEKLDDPVRQDILTDHGLLNAIILVLSCHPGGLVWWGIVCSSWIWMSRGTTLRHMWDPHGDTSKTCVANGNTMLARVVLLVMVAHALGVGNILEQPSSTLMRYHHRFELLANWMDVFMTRLTLGYWGAESKKDLLLFSDQTWLGHIASDPPRAWYPKSEGITTVTMLADGRKHVTGDAGLKATEAYPPLFGAAVAKAYHYYHCVPGDMDTDDDHLCLEDIFDDNTNDEWADAKLHGLQLLLMRLVSDRLGNIGGGEWDNGT